MMVTVRKINTSSQSIWDELAETILNMIEQYRWHCHVDYVFEVYKDGGSGKQILKDDAAPIDVTSIKSSAPLTT